jgi:hypothetical protein
MFLYPLQPTLITNPETIISMINDSWLLQVKKNGCRAIPWRAEGKNDKLKLWGRDGSVLSMSYEKDWTPLLNYFKQPFRLDGELIGRKQAEVSNRLYLWDIIEEGGVLLKGVSYGERYARLLSKVSIGLKHCVDSDLIYNGDVVISVAKSYAPKQWRELLSILSQNKTGENEGFVFKNPFAKLAWSFKPKQETMDMLKFVFKYWKG